MFLLRFRNTLIQLMALLFLSHWACASQDFVGQKVCAECHQSQVDLWSGSHHDWAMREANANSVLGDFGGEAGVEFEHYGEKTRFFQRDQQYWVSTQNSEGKEQTFRVDYTFGFYPLQQYLLDVGEGRLQALSVSWDSRSKEEGGQRWFHLYPDEAIPFDDILHWTGPYQNWNSRCAECHSTNLSRNYDAKTDRYDTQWSEINVSCEACHGPGKTHVKQMSAGNKGASLGFSWSLNPVGQWLHDETSATAHNRSAAKFGDHKQHPQLSVCGSCHARRGLIGDQDDAGEFHQKHNLQLPQTPLYHGDGQIADEVYVLGSFMQSKMHQRGVVCSNCHEPHSLKLRAEGNGVCAQCHRPDIFDQPSHHQHPQNSTGAQCVNCHMPETTYMVVDPRRDHSLRIPRPDLSEKFGTPNACNQCHQDKTVQWASDAVSTWNASSSTKKTIKRKHFSEALAAGLTQADDAQSQLMGLAMAGHQPAIIQAAATLALQNHFDQSALLVAQTQLHHQNPMVRAAGVELFSPLPLPQRWTDLSPLLNDSSKQVRLAVARTLAAMKDIPEPKRALWQRGQEEYLAVLKLHEDTPNGQMNLGLYRLAKQQFTEAEASYQRALAMNSSLLGGYLNLADLYRQQQNESSAEAILLKGLKRLPQVAALHHSLGLSLVRQQKYSAASEALAQAAMIDVSNTRYSYLYGLILQRLDKPQAALDEWQRILRSGVNDQEVLMAAMDQSYKLGDIKMAFDYAQQLLVLNPSDQRLQQWVSQLRRQLGR